MQTDSKKHETPTDANNVLSAVSRHKWVKDDRGKHCEKCGSRVNDSLGAKYIEKDKWGVGEAVNWYPRCFPNSR
jgi:hypothetical protein